MFSQKQIQALNFNIDPSRIKTRAKGNITLSYLEGFDLIDTANKIFGYGNWSYRVTSLEQVSQQTNSNQNIVVCYKALVKVVVYNLEHTQYITKEDVGFGTGISKTLSDSHEGAAKEAVTDALKRALRSFGNQFGNSLYNKNFKSNTQPQIPPNTQTQNSNQSYHTNSYEFSSLYNLGLQVIEQGNNYIVVGKDIFNKKDTIKACGFRWDKSRKLWYLPKEQQVA